MRFTGIAASIVLIGLLLFASFRRKGDVLVLHYSEMKERFTGIDRNNQAVFSRYDGTRVKVYATVSLSFNAHTSPSIGIENDRLCFDVASTEGPLEVSPRKVELYFNKYAALLPVVRESERWVLYLTEKGELINLEPVPAGLH